MEYIFILLVALLIITLVGHGIWEFLAWLFRGGRPRKRRGYYEPTASDDRAAAARHLQRLRSSGLIDPETHAKVMRVLAEDAGQAPPVATYLPRKKDIAITPRAVPAPEPPRQPAEPPKPLSPPTVPARAAEHAGVESIPPIAPPPPIRPEPKPSKPRRQFTEVMVEFMAERNIRWGEIIGGLLILCCSTALVISLWSQIEAIPILKFLIFTTVTAALFGVGLFVQHRWKLPMTGHAILVISSLLVPLNLLAFAAFSQRGPVISGWTVGIELPTVALFGWLTFLAGRVVMPGSPTLFAGGVVGLSICSLIIQFMAPETDAEVTRASLLPVGLYVVVMAVFLRRRALAPWEGDKDAKQSILQLGVQTFACLIPFGLLVYESGQTAGTVRPLSAMLCAIAGPGLVTGAFLSRRLAKEGSPQMRTAATSIALIAAGVMLLCIGLAWPVPSRLMPVLLVNAAAMVLLCKMIGHPVLHGLAATLFTAAWILGVHLASGNVLWSTSEPGVTANAVLSAGTGQALVVATGACLGLAWLFGRRQCLALRLAYGIAGLAFAVISLALVTFFGFAVSGDPEHVTWVYLLYGAFAFVAAGRMKTFHGSWAGCILVQMAFTQMLVYIWPVQPFAWPTALLAGAIAFGLAAIVLTLCRLSKEVVRAFAEPASQFAITVSLAAAVWMVLTLSEASLAAFGARFACISALWMALAVSNRWPVVFAGSQLALVAAACAGTQHHLVGTDWYPSLASAWREPWVWQSHLLVVGSFCLAWSIIRLIIDRQYAKSLLAHDVPETTTEHRAHWSQSLRHLLIPDFVPVDRVLTALVVLTLVVLAAWSVGPELVIEQGWRMSADQGQHSHAGQAGSWILALIVFVTLCLYLSEGLYKPATLGIVLVAACGTALLASRFATNHSVGSAYCWISACMFLATSALFCSRNYWLGKAQPLTSPHTTKESVDLVRLCLFCLFALPVFLVAATHALSISAGGAIVQAAVSDAGLRLTLLGPLTILAIVIVGYGLCEKQPGYAVGAAVLACVAVTWVELCLLGRTPRRVTLEFVVWLVQINTIIFAAVPIVWRYIQWLVLDRHDVIKYPRWPLLAGRSVIGLLLAIAVAVVWFRPGSVPAAVAAAGTIWALFAVILVEWALLATCREPVKTWQGYRESVWVLLAVGLLTCAVSPLDTGNWLCFHVAMVALVLAGWTRLYTGARQVRQLHGAGWQETFDVASAQASGATAQIEHDLTCSKCGYNLRGLVPSGRCPECGTAISAAMETAAERLTPSWASQLADARTQTTIAVLLCTVAGTVFSLRAAADDPQQPWWSAAVLAVLSALCVVLGGWRPRRAFAYAGGVTICLAVSIWWMTSQWTTGALAFAGDIFNLVNVNVIALALLAGCWAFIERRIAIQRSAGISMGRWPALHHTAAAVLTTVVALLAAVALHASIVGDMLRDAAVVTWLAWASVVVLMAVSKVDPRSRHLSAGLYVLGLAAIVRIMAYVGMAPRELAWAFSLLLGGYVLATTLVWRGWTRVLRDATDSPLAIGQWLLYANASLAAVSIVLGVFVSLSHPEIAFRMLIVLSPLLCLIAAWLAVGAAERAAMETCAAALFALAAVLFAWGWIAPDLAAGMLHRAVGLFTAIAALTVISSIAAFKLATRPSWTTAISRCVGGAHAIAIAALLYVAYAEAAALLNGHVVPLADPAVIAMIVAMAVLIIGCILFATSDRFDPLQLKPTAKEAYVYAAEALGGFLALHIRSTMPWLFSGFVTQYWPILVISLAFAAVAAAEICQRYGQRVLARPFGHTGVFLPVLVLPELFLASSQVHYSIVLLATSVLYAVLAFLRRSIVMVGLAGISLNGSLWFLLHHTPGLGIMQHPQLWFIPPALAVLSAGQLNRRRLSEQQQKTLNYGCLLAVYLSSTADVFLIGVAQAPWLPLVLGCLSILGIFFGFASRMRSFLLLGTGFLCLSLLTIIWHAANNLGWTWVWYVAGIVLGIVIITIFALFEKKRQEMRGWLEQLKNWEG